MRINKLRIEHFKSIYDPFTIDFNDINGFWKISGAVGSGKTTIGEALIYGLFGDVRGKNNADLISWGEKHGLVELWCESNNNSLYIKRELNSYGQSPIYVEVNGEELIFTNKRDAQSQLETEYYDTSRITIELLCIISFNNFKSLATLNQAETKKFLDQVLGFYMLTQYADVCKELRQETTNNIRTINQTINNLQGQSNKIRELMNKTRIDGDISDVENRIKQLESTNTSMITETRQLLADARQRLMDKNNELTKIKTLGANKKKEIEFIERGICPTCGAPIDQSLLPTKKAEREVLLNQYKTISDSIADINSDIQRINDSHNEKIDELNSSLLKMRQLLTQLQEQAKRASVSCDEITRLENEIIKNESILTSLQTEDSQWTTLLNILSNDIRSKIMSGFIPALNKNIQHYAQILHQPYIINFDTSFKCMITLCGYDQTIPLSSLSTGQLKTVDMCIILGVINTVLINNSLNIMFLDELFANLDADLRNDMCSVLKSTVKSGGTVFILSHTELEDRFFDGTMYMRLHAENQFEKKTVIKIIRHESQD